MTQNQQLITIAVIAFGTMVTRFLPFLLFRRTRPPRRSSSGWENCCRVRFFPYWWCTA